MYLFNNVVLGRAMTAFLNTLTGFLLLSRFVKKNMQLNED